MKSTSFLDYYKTILEKVSFDSNLFTKEYNKAIKIIHPEEVPALDSWIQSSGFQNLLVKSSCDFRTVEVG